jgi:uncharacterized SAM-binding protein YcdF (DUF218 family)
MTLDGERGGITSKLLSLILIVALVAGLYLFRRPLLRAAGEWWIVEELPFRAEAIVVLGDDNYRGDRAAHAAALFHDGWAPRVVASGRWLRPYASVAELIERDLAGHGVPREAILRFPNSAASTYEEAQAVARLAHERGWRRLVIVTSNYHTRRAGFTFRRTLGPAFELRTVAAPDSAYHPASWWKHRSGRKAFFLEAVGYPLARWEVRRAPAPEAVTSDE